MNQEESFLRAIADDPADNTTRLVYADWLEERGDPRAEFLRLEYELGPGPRVDPRRLALAESVAARGNPKFAEYIRREDPVRRALETRRLRLLTGIGVGWLAIVSKRGPFLLALAPHERVAIELTSQGCLHHRSCAFVFTGSEPLRGHVTKATNGHQPVDHSTRSFLLADTEVQQVDERLEQCRTTTGDGGSTTTNTVVFEWYSEEKSVHRDAFVDRGSLVWDPRLLMLWGWLNQ
jgi:uncharacterized protein (TIGR02996 family)